MNRREFVTALAGITFTGPLFAKADDTSPQCSEPGFGGMYSRMRHFIKKEIPQITTFERIRLTGSETIYVSYTPTPGLSCEEIINRYLHPCVLALKREMSEDIQYICGIDFSVSNYAITHEIQLRPVSRG